MKLKFSLSHFALTRLIALLSFLASFLQRLLSLSPSLVMVLITTSTTHVSYSRKFKRRSLASMFLCASLGLYGYCQWLSTTTTTRCQSCTFSKRPSFRPVPVIIQCLHDNVYNVTLLQPQQESVRYTTTHHLHSRFIVIMTILHHLPTIL